MQVSHIFIPLMRTIGVAVDDANEPPVFADQTIEVREDQATALQIPRGALVATDPDAGQALTLAIVPVVGGDTPFVLNGTFVQLTRSLDFEAKASYQFTAEATDDGVPAASTRATITVTVLDVNEAPVLADAAASVNENSAVGVAVAVAVAVAKTVNLS